MKQILFFFQKNSYCLCVARTIHSLSMFLRAGSSLECDTFSQCVANKNFKKKYLQSKCTLSKDFFLI